MISDYQKQYMQIWNEEYDKDGGMVFQWPTTATSTELVKPLRTAEISDDLYKALYTRLSIKDYLEFSKKDNMMRKIKKVIFNDPATIVIWEDNTKTVVKCGEHDTYDPEKGLAMAIVKKLLGDNQGYYYEVFKKWLPTEKQYSDYEVSEALEKVKQMFINTRNDPR